MSKYKHGDWYCRPTNESEAREIVERAAASGAELYDVVGGNRSCEYVWNHFQAWGVVKGKTCTGSHRVGGSLRYATEYTIEQLRQKFPLPGEQDTEWNGEGLPPMGVECEYSISGSKYKTCTFVGINSRKSIVIENELGEFLTYHDHQIKFRPIQTERERWVEQALEHFCDDDGTETMGRIYDAIKSGELKLPKG